MRGALGEVELAAREFGVVINVVLSQERFTELELRAEMPSSSSRSASASSLQDSSI